MVHRLTVPSAERPVRKRRGSVPPAADLWALASSASRVLATHWHDLDRSGAVSVVVVPDRCDSYDVCVRNPLAVFALDVGSPRQRGRSGLGWAMAVDSTTVAVARTGTDIDSLPRVMMEARDAGAAVALGIEAPLWLPMPDSVHKLSTGRPNERDRSCFAPAGGYVAMLGLQQLVFVLRRLPIAWTFTLDATAWQEAREPVLLWEAFVSGNAHATDGDHVRDAATAAVGFIEWLRGKREPAPVAPDPDVPILSLAAVALSWTGRPTGLAQPAVVVRPSQPFEGPLA